ncbi:hypothetical protein EYC80_007694 [Monilinia laxa]|uniref:Uncharacterized protein n=1 Tax=Monilinia laxa TaxID=61186 RepID=A0A5N6JWP6_MONLA|nr:hypothetical protein EYC80_007694 [Monilinia laxa]
MYVSCTWLENSENLNTRGDGMNLSFRIQSHSRLIGLDSVYRSLRHLKRVYIPWYIKWFLCLEQQFES